VGYCSEFGRERVIPGTSVGEAKVENLETEFRDRLQTTLTGAYRVERELGGGG
jgi:hypothetical protein